MSTTFRPKSYRTLFEILQKNISVKPFTKRKLTVPNLTLLTLAFCVKTLASHQIFFTRPLFSAFLEKYTSVIFYDFSYISWLLERRKRSYFSIFRNVVSVQFVGGLFLMTNLSFLLKKQSFQTRAFNVWFPRVLKLNPQENDSTLDNFTNFFELI